MLVATRTRRPVQRPPSRQESPPWRVNSAVLADALLREHLDASALLTTAPPAVWHELASVVHRMSCEARDVTRSLLGDDTAPPVPADAPAVVAQRDLAVAQRTLARALRSRLKRAHSAMLMTSLARTAELRDIIGTTLENAGRA